MKHCFVFKKPKKLEVCLSYVRKVAVLGITKVNEVAPEAVKGSDLIDILYNMLKDNDTAVAANAISTLGNFDVF